MLCCISQLEKLEKFVAAKVNEPWLEISNNVVCAALNQKKGSDQPAHTRRLIRAFAGRF